jgi:UDP-GlcNAc:undecaprenyl-phosphate GlcNAc-1-phosphate transferase
MIELTAYLFLVSLLLGSLFTPAAIRLGRRWDVLDHPGHRKIHTESMPVTGGWAIFATLTLVIWGHLLGALALRETALAGRLPTEFRYYLELAPSLIPKIAVLYAGAVGIFLIGLADDIRGMSVRARLVVQTFLAAVLVIAGVRPELLFLPPWLAGLVGMVWIVGITNAFNFLDGLDGLSAGVALVASLAFVGAMIIGQQPVVGFLVAFLAGCLLGFLRFNFHPARVFLGSSGSLLIGYLLAVSTLVATFMLPTRGNWLMPILVPPCLLAIPLYDTTSVVIIRLLQQRPVAMPDQSHFHHRLMRAGFTHRETVVFICLIAFAVAISAVVLVQASLLASVLVLVQALGTLSLLIVAERVGARAIARWRQAEAVEPAPPAEPVSAAVRVSPPSHQGTKTHEEF